MKRFNVYASPQFLLFAALLFFFDTTGLVSAAVPAAAVHEIGHVLALRVCGCRIRKLEMKVFGFSMDYIGNLSRGQEVFAALAGPVGGIIFAAVSHLAGTVFESDFLLCTADISLILSVFNMIPALPLDGGRVLSCLAGERCAAWVTTAAAAAMMFAGLMLMIRGYGAALLLSGVWLSLYSCKISVGVVK